MQQTSLVLCGLYICFLVDIWTHILKQTADKRDVLLLLDCRYSHKSDTELEEAHAFTD